MTLDERFDIAAEHMQRMSALAQPLEHTLPIFADCLRHMQSGPDCAACGSCPFTEAVRQAPAGSDSPAEYALKQWQGMAENIAQLRSLLQRQRHSVPVIGYADCTR